MVPGIGPEFTMVKCLSLLYQPNSLFTYLFILQHWGMNPGLLTLIKQMFYLWGTSPNYIFNFFYRKFSFPPFPSPISHLLNSHSFTQKNWSHIDNFGFVWSTDSLPRILHKQGEILNSSWCPEKCLALSMSVVFLDHRKGGWGLETATM